MFVLLLLLTGCADGVRQRKPTDTGDSQPNTNPGADSGTDPGTEPGTDPLPQPQSPGVSFLDPYWGELFTEEESIRVEILAGDTDTPLSSLTLSWGGVITGGAPAVPGEDGTLDFTLDPLPLGTYTATVTATDADGLTDDAVVEFSVVTVDGDGDGYTNAGLGGEDCDDADASINPDADEVCDEVDNDCDGGIDEGVTTRFYADADGDGWGDPLSPADACSVPSGYVGNANDCLDTDATAFPNNPETCDEVDNDCNGEIDEGVTPTWYADTDADGWGDGASTAAACTTPAGYVGNADDCLDTDAAVSPDATEVCQDGLDNDCDGTSNGCGLSGLFDLGGADATVLGANESDYAGYSLAGAGDYDGDGLADILIGAYGNDTNGTGAGAAYVVSGAVSGTVSVSAALLSVYGAAASDGAGYAVAGNGSFGSGDFDGDGAADIMVGVYGDDTNGSLAGAAYVFCGDTGAVALSDACLSLYGGDSGDYAGYAVATVGDTDGDGLSDVLVGAWQDEAGGSLAGAAYLVRGGQSGTLTLSGADLILTGSAGAFAGAAVNGAGDVDADGYDDLLVGGYGVSGAAGAAWLVSGTRSGTLALSGADAIFTGTNAADYAGAAVSTAGDTNNDGYDDVLIGAYGYDYGGTGTGAAYAVFGPISGTLALASADAVLVGESSSDAAGWSLSAAGDMDGDGDDDVLIGAFQEDTNGSAAGSVYLVYGPPASLYDLAGADAMMFGHDASDYAGTAIAAVGDTDGDGRGDILVGAPYADDGGPVDCGTAYLIRGSGL